MLKWGMVALLAAWLALLTLPARPLAAAGVTLSASVGYDGQIRAGRWLPIRVSLTNDGPDQTVTLRIRRGGEGTLLRVNQLVELPVNTRKQIVVPLLIGASTQSFLVQALAGEQVLSETRLEITPLPASRRLVGVVTSTPEATARVIASLSARDLVGQPARLSLADVPTRLQLLMAFDTIIINAANTRALTPEQLAALQGWVAAGGTLVLGGGGNAATVLEGLPELAPVQLNGPATTVTRLPSLEQLTQTRLELAGPFVLASARPQPGASVLAEQEGVPVIVSRPLGTGRVVFSALDLGLDPFLSWPGASSFWVSVTQSSLPSGRTVGPVLEIGNRLSSPLGTGTAFNLPSSGQLALLLVIYILTIGPINYLLLRKFDRREWAWLTTPAITLLFTGALFLFGADARGNQVVINSITIVTSTDGVSGAAVDSYVGVFSPIRANQTLRLPAGTLVSGLPSGGQGLQTPGLDLWYASATEIRDLPFAPAEFKTFVAQASVPSSPLTATLRAEGGRVVGTVTNSSGVAVTDAYLLRGQHSLGLGTIEPGASAPIDWTLPTGAGPTSPPLSVRLNTGPPTNARPEMDWSWRARAQLLAVLLDNSATNILGPGLQVVGWQATPPVSLTVVGSRSRQQTLTFLHHRLNLNLEGQ